MKYKTKELGKFGAFVKQYEKGRQGYPAEILTFLKKLLPQNKPLILDLGCGTGIATRQLVKVGTVIGCDPDPLMLRAAKKHKKINGEKYILGAAEKLPFKDESFDVVTAFSAFHWFDNKKSLLEIHRVLKPGGIIFLVNKTGWKKWGDGYRNTIIKSIGQEIAHFRVDSFNPRINLEKYKFKKIRTKNWKRVELFTLQKALEYVQSISIWKTVPPELRPKAMEDLEKHFRGLKQRTGKIERKLNETAVWATK
jgi:ubiquinone/menaquinone biosynthesis C-methylase UbiE